MLYFPRFLSVVFLAIVLLVLACVGVFAQKASYATGKILNGVPGSVFTHDHPFSSLTILPVPRTVEPTSVDGSDPCATVVEIGFNQTIRGNLSVFDCHVDDTRTANLYLFEGAAGQQIQVDITSTEFATYGGIFDELDFEVQGGPTQGNNTRLTATLPAAGQYLIVVTSLNPYGIGHYSVKLDKTPPCTYQIDPAAITVPAIGGTHSISVTTQPECYWEAVSISHPTVRLLDDGSMRFGDGIIRHRGSGSVVFVINLNESGSTFNGSISIGDLTLQITQPTLECTYSLSSTSATISGSPYTTQIELVTQQGCAWTARNNDSFLGFTYPTTQSNRGPSMLTLQVSANSGAATRVGTLTVAGYTFTVTQAGLNCSYSLPENLINVSASNPTGTFRVNTQPDCTFGFNTGSNGYLVQLLVPAQSGSMDVTYIFQRNYEARSRTVNANLIGGGGTIAIPITFIQAAAPSVPKTITGRVLSPGGSPLRNVRVTLTDEAGNKTYATTSSFGIYSFNAMTGYIYVVSASSRRYRFSAQTVLAQTDTAPIDLFGQE